MKAQDFRRIALGMTNAIEGAHMGHPDFRVNGRIFATLHSDDKHGMVKLPPDQQQRFIEEHPRAFVPENGAWGRQGCTRVRLDAIDEETLGEAITLAWQDMVTAVARRASASKEKRAAGRPKSTRPARRRKTSRKR